MHILVVDDCTVTRRLVGRALRQLGLPQLTITEAGSGAEALAAVENGGFDLVITDHRMPEITGLEFLRRIRTAGNLIPVGMITAQDCLSIRTAAHEAGALFVLGKPITLTALSSALAPFLGHMSQV
ncbi:MAG: response regulator [bacterium]